MGSLSSIFNSSTLYLLSAQNGECAVIYGPVASSPVDTSIVDPTSVGGKLFLYVGNESCTSSKYFIESLVLLIALCQNNILYIAKL